ncbi:hypothetical protein CSPX01_16805 [Colletotrichum filicis]|nr:hypothetical protein CSPX01_16805 [Colletotrichum filicis]
MSATIFGLSCGIELYIVSVDWAVSTPQLVSSLDPSNSTNNPQWQSLHVSDQAHTIVSHE